VQASTVVDTMIYRLGR